jgi:hypothetical protein
MFLSHTQTTYVTEIHHHFCEKFKYRFCYYLFKSYVFIYYSISNIPFLRLSFHMKHEPTATRTTLSFRPTRTTVITQPSRIITDYITYYLAYEDVGMEQMLYYPHQTEEFVITVYEINQSRSMCILFSFFPLTYHPLCETFSKAYGENPPLVSLYVSARSIFISYSCDRCFSGVTFFPYLVTHGSPLP